MNQSDANTIMLTVLNDLVDCEGLLRSEQSQKNLIELTNSLVTAIRRLQLVRRDIYFVLKTDNHLHHETEHVLNNILSIIDGNSNELLQFIDDNGETHQYDEQTQDFIKRWRPY